jgi:sulfur carrier protein
MGAVVIDAVVNGEHRELPRGSTVDDVVTMLSPSRTGIAVAVNGLVVARSKWPVCAIEPGDVVEVLTAAQGG